MMVLKSCKAKECRHPWQVLHPAGNVNNLLDALSREYDTFYHEQPKVSFNSCQLGYLTSEEGPQNANVFGDKEKTHNTKSYPMVQGPETQQTFKYRGHWSIWT